MKWILKVIRRDLKDFGVKFDNWSSQSKLRKSSKIKKTLKLLKARGFIYERDGALWLRSTDFGDDKDRVVIKSDGSFTYIAPDIAYHKDKFERGFKWIIDLWGPDHHGYIPRLKAAIRALGYKEDSTSIKIVQLATLFKDRRIIPMSTRQGEYVTLRQVLDEVGKDAARFFFLMRKMDSHLDFDLALAKEESVENPVYYIQYAHARIYSIFNKFAGLPAYQTARTNLTLLKEPEEIEILRILRQFPDVVKTSGESLEPYRLIPYLLNLTTSLHKFYDTHRVISNNKALTQARLILIDCVRTVLANGLRLSGVSAPKRM
jgi:arginyl-tRNA synthetase